MDKEYGNGMGGMSKREREGREMERGREAGREEERKEKRKERERERENKKKEEVQVVVFVQQAERKT